MANFSKAAASIQAQIAALQAQLQEVLAQEGLVPAPEPEVDAEAALARGDAATMQEAVEQRLTVPELSVEEQAAIEYDKPSISPRRLAAHRERKKQGFPKSRAIVAAARERMRQGEESYDDPDPTGEEYDSAFDGSADSEGRSTYAPSEFPLVGDTGEDEPAPEEGADMSAPDMDGMLSSIVESSATEMPEPAAKDVVVPAEEDEVALRLFKNAHNSSFDPKSSMDKKKMATLRKLLADQGGLGDMTDNQFALKLYRQ
jgi:hypothetical protein